MLKRKLIAIAQALEKGEKHRALTAPPGLKPGSCIVKEWRGSKHTVMTVEGGYEYGGKTYKSLSEIARLITGTRWNGPAFFGLRKTPRADGNR